MDVKCVCSICKVSFSRAVDLERHHKTKHGDTVHTCPKCGKSFNRKDSLQRHRRTCQALRFKCPRCHGLKENIQDLTAHMKLCPVPSCKKCHQEFVELDQLKQHQKTHTKKRKALAPLTLAKRKKKGEFYCRVCMQSFATRQELFLHKVSHMEDQRAYLPVQPHFDFEDERMNLLLRENADLIFRHHRFTQVSADYNFPLTMVLNQDGWMDEVRHALDLVSNLNNTESFKLNVSMGFILMHRETEEYRFFAPHNNNAFFKKPIRIDRPSSWREVYSQMDEESLTAYVTQHRENTKWIPLMVTNVDIQLFYLGVSMGAGELPQFIKTHNCIVGLDKDRHGSLYEDNLCGMRCLAFHLNHKETGDGYRGMEAKTKELKQQWGQGGLDLLRVPEFEDTFNISVDIYSLCEDGSVIPRYLSEGLHQDSMVLNLWDSHLSYVTNIPAYLQKYRCDSCERHFHHLSHWKRHQGSCANATEYDFPGGFHKRTTTIFDRLKDFDIVVDIEQQQYPWFIVYDFEALLSPINEKDQPTPKLKWLRRHKPISVSIASNVDGYETAKCFVNPDPKLLIEEMMEYMASIADTACMHAESK